jgi:hypothetical protein
MENENENMIMTTQRMIASIIEQSVDRESRESERAGDGRRVGPEGWASGAKQAKAKASQKPASRIARVRALLAMCDARCDVRCAMCDVR